MRSAVSVPTHAPFVWRRKASIRPFVERDIPQVAGLHRKVFPPDRPRDLDAYHDYFSRVFLCNPAGQGPLPSLVHQEDDGRITGFLGLVPRRVVAGERTFHALVSSQFIVDPGSAVGLVALQLAKAYLEGPQDLSIADEANDVSRRIWEGLGGTTAPLLSLYWTRPLRPVGLVASIARQRHGLAALAAAARPLALAADAVVARLPGSPLGQSDPGLTAGDLSAHDALAHVAECCGPHALRVAYDSCTLQWLFDRVASRQPGGRALSSMVRDGHKVVGWYVCLLGRDGVAEVAQLAATPSSVCHVLDHLFFQAWRQGAIAATGRVDARHMQALSDKYCVFHRRGPWVLVKTDRLELLEPFRSGDVCFSRLDGEWSLRF